MPSCPALPVNHPHARQQGKAGQQAGREVTARHARCARCAAGVLLNQIFPNWLVVFILIVAMVWQIQLMLRKGLALRRQELEARAAAEAAALEKLPGEEGGEAGAPTDPAGRRSWLTRAWGAVREEIIQQPQLGRRALLLLGVVGLIWAGFVAFQVRTY